MRKNLHWEIGSEFHWFDLPYSPPLLPWPEPNIFYSLGRDALLSVWQFLKNGYRDKVLFVPDYFCHEVIDGWERSGIIVRFYEDDPRWTSPDWKTLSPTPGDIVLAVNYFGVRVGDIWYEWQKKNPSVVLIEDHSHDPFSSWALNSKADYAFASIRKTFPIPDGAILWSPIKRILPPKSVNKDWTGSALKLAAMIIKREYLVNSVDPKAKHAYREFQIEGEKIMAHNSITSISDWSYFLISSGFPDEWRKKRESNVMLLFDLIKGFNIVKPLFSSWPTGYCPFNAILVFNSESFRNRMRSILTSKGIYTSIHWVSYKKESRMSNLSERILTIPADQRYDSQDMYRIASVFKCAID